MMPADYVRAAVEAVDWHFHDENFRGFAVFDDGGAYGIIDEGELGLGGRRQRDAGHAIVMSWVAPANQTCNEKDALRGLLASALTAERTTWNSAFGTRGVIYLVAMPGGSRLPDSVYGSTAEEAIRHGVEYLLSLRTPDGQRRSLHVGAVDVSRVVVVDDVLVPVDPYVRPPEPHTIVAPSENTDPLTVREGQERTPPPALTAPAGTSVAGGSDALIPVEQLAALTSLDLTKLGPEDIGLLRDRLLDAKRDYAAQCGAVIDRIDAELVARIKADGGRALPSWDYRIELEEQHSAYAFDDAALRNVMGALPPADAEKIGKIIPAHVEQVPERFVRGKTNSIQALVTKYGEQSAIGKALAAAMSRSKLGEKLICKRITDGEDIVAEVPF